MPGLLRALLAWLVLLLCAVPAEAQRVPRNADRTVNMSAVCLPCRGLAQTLVMYEDALGDLRQERARRTERLEQYHDAAPRALQSRAAGDQAIADSQAIEALNRALGELDSTAFRLGMALQDCIQKYCTAATPGGQVLVDPGRDPQPIDPNPQQHDALGVTGLIDIFSENSAEEERRYEVAQARRARALCEACRPQEQRMRELEARYDALQQRQEEQRTASDNARTALWQAERAYHAASTDAGREQAHEQWNTARSAFRAARRALSALQRERQQLWPDLAAAIDALAACNQRYCTGTQARLESVVPGGGNNPFNPTDPTAGGGQTGGTAGGTAGVLQFSSATYAGGEGGAVLVTVTRSGGSRGAASVDYATDSGTATSGSDFTATRGTLNWADGDAAAKFFSVPLRNDSEREPAETFSVRLSRHVGAARGTPDTATVTINDSDGPPPAGGAGALQFEQSAFSVGEGAGVVTIRVLRVGGSAGAVSVQTFTGAGTASANSDYTPTSVQLSWAAGDTAPKSYTIPIVNDTTTEPTEQFFVTLNNPTGGATLGAPSTASVTITDDDQSPPGLLQFQVAAVSVNEGGGAVTLTVTRTGGSGGAVTVQYGTAPDSATAGSDFAPTNGTLAWPAGDASPRTITVPIVNDTVNEATERFFLDLSNPTGGATLGPALRATITIQDNDAPPQTGHLWLGNTGASYACSATPGAGSPCEPCPPARW